MPALTPQDIQVVRWGPPGPAGVGITSAEKTSFDSRIGALEGRVLTGSGGPEGLVTGDTGDVYLRTDAVVGYAQQVWIKFGGTTTRGWLPVDGVVRHGVESQVWANPGAATLGASGCTAWSLNAGTITNNDHTSGPSVDFATSATLNNDA